MLKFDEAFWIDYKKYLVSLNQSHHTIRNKIQHAKRFYFVLQTQDAHSLLTLSKETRSHAMKSLSSLSKYLGQYDDWQKLIKRFQLKWEQKDSLDTFKRIFENNEESYNHILEWIKTTSGKLPSEYANAIVFNTLTGLRPDESLKSINLIKSNSLDRYMDSQKLLLYHYQFPEIFLRVSKKAFITILNNRILELAYATPTNLNYAKLRKKMKKFGIPMHLYYCRKVFATYLRNRGIESEIIDLLQGRISSSVFVNHYYRPDIKEIITKRIRPVLDELMKEIMYS
ncbi:MAG TPA: integrase [Candidatus Nitrosocosmicus sp.]|nr:integrase [Candidatus Nitrosocosmicus sp.]